MPWVTPPTFSYGYPASVDDLNIVRNNLLYLYGEIYTTASATLESEVKCNSPFDGEKIAAILWIEHKADNLYYRIRAKSQNGATDYSLLLDITYWDTADPAVEKGLHTESIELEVDEQYYLMTNSDAAVDISGWGLTVGDLYKIEVSARCTDVNDDNKDVWIEVQFMYEAP
jgi:hypothetical protein